MENLFRYNRLTESEFMLLKGTDKMSRMLSNKFKTRNFDVVEWLEENSIAQYCVIKQDMDKSWLIYFDALEDAHLVMSNFAPEEPEAPEIRKINIVDEFNE
jgi:hypothetical protein